MQALVTQGMSRKAEMRSSASTLPFVSLIMRLYIALQMACSCCWVQAMPTTRCFTLALLGFWSAKHWKRFEKYPLLVIRSSGAMCAVSLTAPGCAVG